MVISFPDLERLRLALVSGAIPPSVALAPARAGEEPGGWVWVEPSAPVSRTATDALRRLGAGTSAGARSSLGSAVTCWPQILPLARGPASATDSDRVPVLFELAEEDLGDLVTEILRLGNDRQSYRILEPATPESAGGRRALLRVVGPPYFSLLRALDREGGGQRVAAYVEQSPRVWVEYGYRHPLGDMFKAPPGSLLLLRSPRDWRTLPESAYRDIYEVLEFPVPGESAGWRDSLETGCGSRIRVPLRLARGGPSEGAELWVLRDDAERHLEDLVRAADDHLLTRLAFAVGEQDGRKVILVRARPSKGPPPALALPAVGYRSYLRLPNLFLPVGTHLRPPLRRDAVRRHLAADPGLLSWLEPESEGRFTRQALPDVAFRPLADFVDYVLEHDRPALEAWAGANVFEFEGYEVREERTSREPAALPGPALPTKKARAPGREPSASVSEAVQVVPSPAPATPAPEPPPPPQQEPSPPPDQPAVPAGAEELAVQLRQLEEDFLAQSGELDAEPRRALWPRLADLYVRTGDGAEGGLCWVNTLWLAERPAPAPAREWFRAESQALASRRGTGAAALSPPGDSPEEGARFIEQVLALSEPPPAALRVLAAVLAWSALQPGPPSWSAAMVRVAALLEAHERLLPVRMMWLAWLALAQLSDGDALALARARDRVLARLYQGGLRPDQDLPRFLRIGGPSDRPRSAAVRAWLIELAERARLWIEEKGQITSSRVPKTGAYADLMFAFGLARLGEGDASTALLRRATDALQGQGEAHEFLLNALAYRVRQAQQGQPHRGPLPAEQMELLAHLVQERQAGQDKSGPGAPYVIDRMRLLSRILEPDQRVEPYRHTIPSLNELERSLRGLPDILDPDQVAGEVQALLRQAPRGQDARLARARVLAAALDQAPRVGEAFARDMLAHTMALLDELPVPTQPADRNDRAEWLERALFVAAHFDDTAAARQALDRLYAFLDAQREQPDTGGLDALAGQGLRGLRKLGLRRESETFLQSLAEVLLKGAEPAALDAAWGAAHPEALRSLLQVAGGWYYLGRLAQADAVIRIARDVFLAPVPRSRTSRPLLSGREVVERALLARAYAAALSQAPLEPARERLDELFERLEGLLDTFTTNDHYSQCQLQVIEGVVLAVASEDFVVGSGVRRWLDEDEALVRRRVHADVRRLVPH